jgi:tape measure domain-containing protein
MAKLNLGAGKTLEQIREIIKEIERLKASSNTSGKATAAVFSRLEATLKKLEQAALSSKSSLSTLATSVATQNSKLSEWAKLLANLEKAKERLILVNTKENASLQSINNELAKANKAHKDAANALEIETKARQKANEARIKEANQIASNKATLERQRQASLKVAAAERELATAYNQLKSKTAAAVISAKEMASAHGINSTEAKKAAESARKLVKELKAVDNSVKVGARSMKNAFSSVITGAGALLSAFGVIGGIQLFASIIQSAFALIKTFDGVRFALEKIAGDAQQTASSFRFLSEITNDYGVELVATSQRWIKFLAAAKQSGITLLETENIFRSMTKAAGVLGLKTDELTGVYLALEQMLSKGKVTTEELRRQLGERLPGAFGIMAASMGVSLTALDKMLKKGQVLSAEVLPGFARAVELAYGIDSTTKVDTLTAAQNRLKNAWDKFIISITSGSSAIKNFFNNLATGYEFYIRMFGTAEEKRELVILERSKIFQKNMFDAARKKYDEELELGNKFWNIKEKMEASKAAVIKNRATKDYYLRDKQLKDQADKDTKIYLDYVKVIDGYQKEHANKGIEQAKKNFDMYTDLNEINKKDLLELEDKYGFIGKNKRLLQARKQDKELSDKLTNATVIYDYYLKLTEVSNAAIIDADDDSTKNKIKNLKLLDDQWIKISINSLKKMIEANKISIESEETNYKEKQELADDNRRYMSGIAVLEAREARDTAKESNKERLQAAKESLAEGRMSHSNYTEYVKSAELNLAQELVIIKQDMDAKIEQNEENHQKELIKLKQINQDRVVALVKKEHDERIIAASDAFEAELEAAKKRGDTKKQIEKLVKAHELNIKNISIESANAQIEIIIELLKAERTLLVARGMNVEALDIQITALEASLKSLKEGNLSADDTITKQKEIWKELIGIANDFAQAVGDIFSAQLDRRIENINAEIEAEKNKYDKLIELSEDDKERKEALERQRDDRVRILEEKRLRAQQKQAKIQKAFAVADIAMKLGQTIISIQLAAAAQDAFTPYALGSVGALYRAIQIPLAIATSAAQIAAVLSAPIPQFAEGGRMKKTGVALINDGGKQEYVERNGQLHTTTSKNALVTLQAGDTVYKDYDDMVKNSMFVSSALGGNIISQREFNSLFYGIKDSIEKGFNKAKINNNIKLNGFDSSKESYRQSLSRWN